MDKWSLAPCGAAMGVVESLFCLETHYKKSPLSKVTARSLRAILCNVMLCLVMIIFCNFQPTGTSFRKSSDNLIMGFLCLKPACGQVFGNGQTTLKTLEERARLQELGQARPPRALSLSKHRLSYHLGGGNHFWASFTIQNAWVPKKFFMYLLWGK